MRLTTIVKKNFKLLFRNKASAFVVILGPMLIILLVALAFNNTTQLTLNVGAYIPDKNSLSDQFITGLEDDDFVVTEFFTKEECIQRIKEGVVHTCIAFPEDFRIDNEKTNMLEFYVDNSRQNLVFQVIESVKGVIQGSSEALSLNLTGNLLDTISITSTESTGSLARLTTLEAKASKLRTDLANIKTEVQNMDLEAGSASIGGILTAAKSVDKDVSALTVQSKDIISLADDFEEDVSTSGYDTTSFKGLFTNMTDDFDDMDNETETTLKELFSVINSTENNLKSVTDKLATAKAAKVNINARATTGSTDIATVNTELAALRSSLERVQGSVQGISVTDAENIVSPITTSVVPVSSEQSQLVYIFPFILVLIIMFVGILLSSTLIVIDKNSPAFFRTFTTATHDEYFIFSTYITALMLVLAQVIVLMALSAIFLHGSVFGNWQVTFLHLFLTSSLFVMIGMAIGYLFNTQQAANIMSISAGSVFLFLSNLVLPLESINPALRTVTMFNPYVMASEVLRKSTVFKSNFLEVQIELGMLMLYAVLVLIFILMTHKISKLKYFGKLPHIKGKLPITLGEDNYFEIGEKFVVRSKGDLLVALRNLPSNEFQYYIAKNRKEFALWIKEILKDPTLARKMKRKNQADMVAILETVVDPKELPKPSEITQELKKEGEEVTKDEDKPEEKKGHLFGGGGDEKHEDDEVVEEEPEDETVEVKEVGKKSRPPGQSRLSD